MVKTNFMLKFVADTEVGPQVDTTTSSADGWFIYLDSSLPAKEGEKGILISDLILPTEQQTSFLSLYYFMYLRRSSLLINNNNESCFN